MEHSMRLAALLMVLVTLSACQSKWRDLPSASITIDSYAISVQSIPREPDGLETRALYTGVVFSPDPWEWRDRFAKASLAVAERHCRNKIPVVMDSIKPEDEFGLMTRFQCRQAAVR